MLVRVHESIGELKLEFKYTRTKKKDWNISFKVRTHNKIE